MGPYMEAMRTGPVEYVLTSTEAAAGFMATVCGMLTGRPGACYGTYGPGATNLCTGVGTALELPSIIPTLRADRKNKRHFAPAARPQPPVLSVPCGAGGRPVVRGASGTPWWGARQGRRTRSVEKAV